MIIDESLCKVHNKTQTGEQVSEELGHHQTRVKTTSGLIDEFMPSQRNQVEECSVLVARLQMDAKQSMREISRKEET
jgi:hypothetical protein